MRDRSSRGVGRGVEASFKGMLYSCAWTEGGGTRLPGLKAFSGVGVDAYENRIPRLTISRGIRFG